MPHNKTDIEQTRARREDAARSGTYDFYFEIDCDCEELLDAIGLDYKEVEDDETQNEVALHLTRAEATEVLNQTDLQDDNEQTIAMLVLNDELSEYTTKVTIYTPSGDKICFS